MEYLKEYVGIKLVKATPLKKGDAEGYEVLYEDGYRSWSPKDVFEKAYRENGNLTFAHALEMVLKHRKKIARKGWNASGQYITLIPAGNAIYQGYPMQDCLGIKNAQGLMQPGWVPSQGDMTAEDWIIVGEW